MNNCNHPQPRGWVAVVFFAFFSIIGSLVLFTLLIGVVTTAMEEYRDGNATLVLMEMRTTERIKALMIDNATVEAYRAVFQILDTREENKISRDALKTILRYLPPNEKVSFSSSKSHRLLTKITSAAFLGSRQKRKADHDSSRCQQAF